MDKSSKPGENGYIDRHHILPKNYRGEGQGKRIKLTVQEHREIHSLIDPVMNSDDIDEADKKDSILKDAFFIFLENPLA